MTFSEYEKQGISELLLTEENTVTLLQLAKSLIKNTTTVSTGEEALNLIFAHGVDANTLLNKKLITKDLLFKYLNKHHVTIELNITKTALIAKTLDYWKNSSQNEKNCDTSSSIQKPPSTNTIASAFAEWFFEKYNSDKLQENDFWPNANLILHIIADDATEESTCQDSKSVCKLLMEKKSQFGFYFNLNTNSSGIQGRLDIHGMLLVLTCGTLHTRETCVGVFEWMFGLLQDPYESKNWKMKTLRCLLRSQGATQMPTLNESESLKAALAIQTDLDDYDE